MPGVDQFLPVTAVEAEEEFDPYIEATLEFEEVSRRLDLEDWIVHRLRHPERQLIVHLPLAVEGGQVITFTGYRVQHSTVRGPSMGGVHVVTGAQLSHVKASAMAMTWQCALFDLPFGGAAGAIVCDPAELSERDLRRLVRDYFRGLRGFVGPFQDVLVSDPSANDRILTWMAESCAEALGAVGLGAVIGKPLGLGGLPLHATGLGFFFLLQEILAERKVTLRDLRVTIQGFGNVAAAVATLLWEAGARVVAVSDASGGLYSDRGLRIRDVQSYVTRQGVLFGYPEAEAITNAELLEAECDVLIPAAAPRQIHARNAGRVRARIVLEGASGALTARAEKTFEGRGVLVVPHILSAGGGAIGSFLEWVKQVRCSYLPCAEVDERLKALVRGAYLEAAEMARRHGVTLRCAAHLLAVDRIAAQLRYR